MQLDEIQNQTNIKGLIGRFSLYIFNKGPVTFVSIQLIILLDTERLYLWHLWLEHYFLLFDEYRSVHTDTIAFLSLPHFALQWIVFQSLSYLHNRTLSINLN